MPPGEGILKILGAILTAHLLLLIIICNGGNCA